MANINPDKNKRKRKAIQVNCIVFNFLIIIYLATFF